MDNKSKNKDIPDIVTEEDFSNSIAKLAELAAKDLGPDKPNKNKETSIDDEILKEFLQPKKKNKPKSWKEKWAGKTVKIKINPYVASGIMVILLAAGFLATPQIARYLDERRLAEEEKQIQLALIAETTDDNLKSYSLFDAAKDVGGDNELKTQSIKELAASVREANLLVQEKQEKNASNENIDNDIDIQTVNEEYYSYLTLGEANSDMHSLTISEIPTLNFNPNAHCSFSYEPTLDEQKIFEELMSQLTCK